MRMRSPIPKKHARIEIIPLIDIMFFLLASFMMVSLSQTHMKGIRVNLPAPNYQPTTNPPKDYVSVRVTEGNQVYFDNKFVPDDEVLPQLYNLYQANHAVKVSLSAEKTALHGNVITVLDRIRSAGIQKIGYQIKTASEPGTP
jgi:biopolymer transport protein ExbD